MVTKKIDTLTPEQSAMLPVIRDSGHAHTLTGAGFFDAAPVSTGSLVVGTLTVPADTDVLLTHPEHGAFLIAPGTYRIGTQREFAGEWRAVAD